MIARATPILAAVALLLAGNGLLGAALPGRWLREGIDAGTIAALGSATYFGVLLGAVFAIALVFRLGSGRAAGLFALLFAGSTLALAAVSTPGPLALLRLTGGFGLAGLTLLIESALNARAAPTKRGRLLAIYMVVFYLAQAAGAALSGPAGGSLALAAGAILLSALPLARAGIAAPAASNGLAGAASVPRLAQRGTLAGFSAGLLLGTFYALAPLAAREAPGAFMAAAMAGGVAGLLPIGAAADRHGPMPVLVAAYLGVALASAWLVASSWSGEPASLAAGFAFGLGGFSCYPLASAALNRTAAPKARLAVNGRLILVSGLGGCLGPLAAAALTPRCGPAAGFVVIGSATAITAALIALPRSFFQPERRTGDQQPRRDHDPVVSPWPPR
ncbi:MAG: MFS transporter [Rhodospirillaceae bacterium]